MGRGTATAGSGQLWTATIISSSETGLNCEQRVGVPCPG